MSGSIEILRECLSYNPETGNFTWLERPVHPSTHTSAIRAFNTKYAGSPVYEELHRGYLRIKLAGKRYKAHRVAWALYYGEWPAQQIDHINGVKTDNRIENLRAASPVDNSRNQPMPASNMSGVVGVSWNKRDCVWVAKIGVGGEKLELCRTRDFDEAVAARKAAETKYGFHPNHGRPLEKI